MNKSMALEPATEEEVQYKAQIDHNFTEMKRLNSEMVADQQKIDTLKIETRMLAAETRLRLDDIWATLARIEAI